MPNAPGELTHILLDIPTYQDNSCEACVGTAIASQRTRRRNCKHLGLFRRRGKRDVCYYSLILLLTIGWTFQISDSVEYLFVLQQIRRK